MAKFTRPAIRIEQGGRHLFLTYLTVRDLRQDNFYRVDKLDVEKSKGMQRLHNPGRSKKLANYIVGANKHDEAFLPTSIFLATVKTLSYSEEIKELSFDTDVVGPFDVVDGQHRIEGLKIAADQDPGLVDFPISTVVAHNLKEPEMMKHFFIVNTTQVVVDDSVKQGIIARFNKMQGTESLLYLPSDLEKKVAQGRDKEALDIAMKLNGNPESPWFSLIRLANKPKERTTVKQSSFVKSVKRHLLSPSHPYTYGLLSKDNDEKIATLNNYWKAIKNICVGKETDERNTRVFKYTGLEFFHYISATVFVQLARNSTTPTVDRRVETIESCINSAKSKLKYTTDMLDPDYWKVGGKGKGLNDAGIRQLASEFNIAFSEAHGDDEKT